MRLFRKPVPVRIDILVVCTGNYCRSPLAEAILQEKLGDQLIIQSAGTLGVVDSSPHPYVVQVLEQQRFDASIIDRLRPTKIRVEEIERSALILTATADHRREVVELLPSAADKVFTFVEFDRLISGVAPSGGSPRERLDSLVAAAAARLHEDWITGVVEVDESAEDLPDPLTQPLEAFQECFRALDEALHWSARL